ncbi:cellulose binding domain-containing protein [Catellatospora sp. KI3]|uniref:glucuronyl esterase domain-containing protein n=1 Tax=Catellatospora sp. KI3 TaxID=3041620 RepID=UPI002482E611|nr:cellulose binding domain-containing protein [Catellatospora sp. KI3]MDI1464065.1 cellulose binding domain-containing protein [Catellatospora sp. KI3]
MFISPDRARIRSAIVALTVSAIAFAGAVTLARSTTAAAAAPLAAGVEDEGADCAVNLPGTTTAGAKLPDPFKRLDGTRVTTRSDWRCRREEIRKLSERYVYGTKPARPAGVTGTVSRTGITVNVSDGGRSAGFSATVSVPGGTGPFPAVVVVGGLGADTATILAAGVAVINYDPLAVGKEGTARGNKQGAFYSVYGATSSTGLLAAWAWGVSRIIDVIEQSGGTVLKADSLGVTGCSRYGKGAFAIGAFDQRIALTMPIESGSGGVPAFRAIAGESGAQPLSSAYSEQPWLGDAFGPYTGNPAGLPVDQHETVAMIAPRGLFIMENPRIDWLAARSGSVSALAGAEVYKALGAGDNITYWSDVADGTHCAVRPEWRTPLQQHLQKFLLRTGSAAGTFRISSLKAGNLAEWRDWQTPVLTDTPPSSPPPSPSPSGASPSPSRPPSPSPSASSSPPPTGACVAAFRTVNSWPGGFQGEVTVTAGASAISGWTAAWTLGGGQSISQLWNGTLTVTGSAATVKNLSWNGALGAGASTAFGFLGTGSPAASGLACTSP